MAIALPTAASGQTLAPEGIFQTEPLNVYEVDADEEIASGQREIVTKPGETAEAEAQVLCARSASCADPGAVWQSAQAPAGTASNAVAVRGTRVVSAEAQAQGGTAAAEAAILTALWQSAEGATASNQLTNSGTFRAIADAAATATLGDAAANAAFTGAGIYQDARSTDAAGGAANRLTSSGVISVIAEADATATAGSAMASAAIETGLRQQSIAAPVGDAFADLVNSGDLNFTARADAAGDEAVAFGHVSLGAIELALAESGSATVSLNNAPGADPVAEPGTITISAGAGAAGAAGATASADIGAGIAQVVYAADSGTADLVNSGTIGITADANASAESGSAFANAVIASGIVQFVSQPPVDAPGPIVIGEPVPPPPPPPPPLETASIAFANSGTIGINVSAAATGTNAQAGAANSGAVVQSADALDASVLLSNAGQLDITADAVAVAEQGDATAGAVVAQGAAILQFAIGVDGDAGVELENSGTLGIAGSARASATGEAGAGGNAEAAVLLGAAAAYQSAGASEAATASLTNDGTFSVKGEASAVGDAFASAAVFGYIKGGFQIGNVALSQGADGAAALAAMANNGVIDVALDARASGGTGANAVAIQEKGIFQSALGYAAAGAGSAKAEVANSGDIDITASAQALAGEGVAQALGIVGFGLSQLALGVTEATVAFRNLPNSADRGLAVAAEAQAVGGTALAVAIVSSGIAQVASAVTDGPSLASVELANSGHIDIAAAARADGVEIAVATGVIGTGILQRARTDGTNAAVTAALANEGSLDVAAGAGALGDEAASAIASVFTGVAQWASSNGAYDGGTGSVSASLANSGTLAVGAKATAVALGVATEPEPGPGPGPRATALVGTAFASASVLGITQNAFGKDARATLENDDSIAITADAEARAPTAANALAVVLGISQQAVGYSATSSEVDATGLGVAALANSGAVDIRATARAAASAGAGGALAAVQRGIIQQASGTAGAKATLVNAPGDDAEGEPASIEVSALAVASGAAAAEDGGPRPRVAAPGIAEATGQVSAGIDQVVSGAESPSVSILNEGAINIDAAGLAAASGAGGSAAKARGEIGTGIFQLALTSEMGGSAGAALANGGTIDIAASAGAAGSLALAEAIVGRGVSQNAYATTAASITLANSGTLSVSANAAAEPSAQGSGGVAQAAAAIVQAIAQSAVAGPEALGAAELTNTGAIDVAAAASATGGGSASAAASVAVGLAQVVGGGSVAGAIANSGTVDITALAKAEVDHVAFATATIGAGVYQSAAGATGATAALTVNNSGAMRINVAASAAAGDVGTARAGMISVATSGGALNEVPLFAGITQIVDGAGHGSAELVNSGTLDITLRAQALAGDLAHAAAGGDAIVQSAQNTHGADLTIDNDGDLTVAVEALAHATNAAGRADAAWSTALMAGIFQVGTAIESGSHPQTTVNGTVLISDLDALGPVAAALANSGSIDLSAKADAVADGFATALAQGTAVAQLAVGSDAAVSLSNSGTMDLEWLATAQGRTALAVAGQPEGFFGEYALQQVATATEFHQSVGIPAAGGVELSLVREAVGPASLSLANSGSLTIVASGEAEADDQAAAEVWIYGIKQFAKGKDASASIANSGTLTMQATGKAEGAVAVANAYVEKGIWQDAYGTRYVNEFHAEPSGTGELNETLDYVGAASASITNSGIISFLAGAHAVGEDQAGANAEVGTAIMQFVAGTAPSMLLRNTGTINAGATAEAKAAVATAFASIDLPLYQAGIDLFSPIEALIDNKGKLNIDALAKAEGSEAYAGFHALGGGQSPTNASAASFTIDNKGVATIDALARADGDWFAHAHGTALGFFQTGQALDFNDRAALRNSGDLVVNGAAEASADAQTGVAFAGVNATGYRFSLPNGGVDVENSGTLAVTADALTKGAAGLSYAVAVGIDAQAQGEDRHATDPRGNDHLVHVTDGALAGTIKNSGDIIVAATATGKPAAGIAWPHPSGIPQPGGPLYTPKPDGPPQEPGEGPGGEEPGGEEPGTPTPRASGDEDAIGGAMATAVGAFLASGSNNVTLINSGTIQALATTNGGTSSAFGVLAFDNGWADAGAHDRFSIVNEGGKIIAAVSDDGGESYRHGFAIDLSRAPNASTIQLRGNGLIYGHIDVLASDSIIVAAGETALDGWINPGGEREGILSINGGGSLFLRDDPQGDMYAGAAGANVDSFTMWSGATLAIQLSAGGAGTADASLLASSGPHIVANTAKLAGTLEIRPVGLGLWDDLYQLDDVIDADTLSGAFDQVRVVGAGALIGVKAIKDNGGNVDVEIKRKPFGQLGGESAMQAAVGAGIEDVYDPSLQGAFADMLVEFFTFDDDTYYASLDQLSGSQYAGYAETLRRSSLQLSGVVSDQVDCTLAAGGVEDCRGGREGGRLWALASQQNGRIDADAGAPGVRTKGQFALLGAEYSFGDATIGVFGGYRGLDASFDQQDGKIEAHGGLLGVHAGYDMGAFYARGIVNYAMLDGDSTRSVAIGSISAQAKGDPVTKLLTLRGEVGARLPLGTSWFTPFASIEHFSLTLDGFSESGAAGANLRFDAQREARTTGTAGLKWAANWGGLVSQANVAYRHDFGDTGGLQAQFAEAPGGSGFRITAPETGRDAVVAGFSLGGALSKSISGRIGYQGSFANKAREDTLFGTLTIRLGGPSR